MHTIEDIRAVAAAYPTRSAFKAAKSHLYKKATKLGVIDDVCPPSKRGDWTVERMEDVASKAVSREWLAEEYKGLPAAARRNYPGGWKALVAHIPKATRKPYGAKLMPGQVYSTKYEGFIDCGGREYRQMYFRENVGRWGSRRYIEVECAHCGKTHLSYKSNRNKYAQAFCSQTCKHESVKVAHMGNRRLKPSENGGHYVRIVAHGHPNARSDGAVYEHHLVIEKIIGRPLKKGEMVHHINCVKNDNRPDNLVLCKDASQHRLMHGSLNKCVEELIGLGVLTFDRNTNTYKVQA